MIGFINTYFTITHNHTQFIKAHNKSSAEPLTTEDSLHSRSTTDCSESYVMTDGQSASLSWKKAPIWGLRPNFYYCQTVTGLLMWGTLTNERTGLSFTIAAGHRQHSHSWVRVPWDSWPYFTVSGSTVKVKVKVTLRLEVYRQSVRLGVRPLETHDQRFFFFKWTLEVIVLM
jgi:hypothetical protein